jgi:hypothetical protein
MITVEIFPTIPFRQEMSYLSRRRCGYDGDLYITSRTSYYHSERFITKFTNETVKVIKIKTSEVLEVKNFK